MSDGTAIEWTDATWNPITGCSVVSPGCTNCYAMRLAGTRLRHHPTRIGLTRDTKAGPVWTGDVRFNDRALTEPLRWKKPRMIFVCAHGDLFHENVPEEWIDRIFAVMALCPQHIFQVLTKRSARMRAYMAGIQSKIPFLGRMPLERVHLEAAGHMEGDGGYMDALKKAGNVYSLYLEVRWPLPNVWLGVSAEDQARADERIPDLLATPAAVRWVSAEPLLGSIDFEGIAWPQSRPRFPATDDLSDGRSALRMIEGSRLDWIVVGGESGPHARPMHPQWARDIRDQCAAGGVPFFFKQHGEWIDADEHWDAMKRTGFSIMKDGKTVDVTTPLNFNEVQSLGEMIGARECIAYSDGSSVLRVGKKAAGRTLDGREHNGMPQVPA